MKGLWREYVECFFFHSMGFTGWWTLLNTARWWTLIHITHSRRSLQRGLTTSFTEYTMSTLSEKSALSSCTDISLIKCTLSTRVNESACWCWKVYEIHTNTRVLSSANENESVHCWAPDTRAWLKWQQDRQILVECERLLKDALLSLSDWHQLLFTQISVSTGGHSSLLLITVISSYFETLLRITYSNIDLFVLHNKKQMRWLWFCSFTWRRSNHNKSKSNCELKLSFSAQRYWL
jgi:hypothetical protein